MREIEMHVEPTRISDSHTSKGNQLKWEQDGCWYKADAFGYESLAEVVCSNILVHSNLPRPVCYEPVTIIYHGKRYRGCRSKNFKDENEILIPIERLCRQYTGMGLARTLARFADVEERISYTVDLITNITGLTDCDRYLTQMLELDAFFLNEDRHTNNIAVLYNERTKEYRFCPFFDMGLALFADTTQDYPLGADVETCLTKVQAKPYARDFDEQLDAANALYGCFLKFEWNTQQMCAELERIADQGNYTMEECRRVEQVLHNQARKYAYLMP